MSEPAASRGRSPGTRSAMIVLAYLWILALVPLLAKGTDREVQWHARHGIVLLAAELLLWTAFSALTALVIAVSGGLAHLLGLLAPLIWLFVVAIHTAAILKGISGRRLIIPGLSRYANRR